MATIIEEKASPTFEKLGHHHSSASNGTTPTPNAYRDDDGVRMSIAEKNLMKHRSHTTLTDMPNISSRFIFKTRQSALHRTRTISHGKLNTKTDPSFTPRVTIGGGTTDAVDGGSAHYTPDWFKMSIRTVDRDTIRDADEETKLVTSKIVEICKLRDKWIYSPNNTNHIGAVLGHGEISLDVNKMIDKLPKSIEHKFECKFEAGIMKVISKNSNLAVFEEKSFDEYLIDLQKVMDLVSLGPAKTMCYRRLKILHSRFILHQWLNDKVEVLEVKSIPHRDFYNVRKIDNHVHHSACMHQKHLLRFIKRKLKKEPDTICFKTKDGKEQTLQEVFEDIGMTGHELSIDALDMHAHQETFQRFDKFNAKYNPVGKAQLRTVFLKTDNLIKGRYLAEITKEVSVELEASKYQFAEYRLSIYGKKKKEWDIMGDWICNNKLYSQNVRWLIQMPRIYGIFRNIGLPTIKSFNDMMENFFEPLFEVTLNPSSHPSLHLFLQMVVGFDSVDDESQPEQKRRRYPDPSHWTMKENPPYVYYMYYTWVNIVKLNRLREERGMNVFSFRPHCGEAGGFDHLGSAFLLANSINHGIRLKQAPVLQYLYYLKQIGLAMSPLSNNILFTVYDSNPFPSFFKRGLNIALSTDDPLLIHYTKDALLEEYSIAAQVYNLSSIDLCELARNSVIQSGFDKPFKEHCIGRDYHLRGSLGNNIYQSNVPDARLDFRSSILQEEENFIKYAGYPQEMMRKHSINSFAINEQQNNSIIHGADPSSIGGAEILMGFPSTFPENKEESDIPQFVVPLRDSKAFIMAENMAINVGQKDITKAPPHTEWMQLAKEKQRLEIIRDELFKFVQSNKKKGNEIQGLQELEHTMSKHGLYNKPNLHQSDTSNTSIETGFFKLNTEEKEPQLNDKKSISEIAKNASLNNDDKSNNNNPLKTKQDLEKAKKKLYRDNKDLNEGGLAINDIRGLYFDENDILNEIDKKFNVKISKNISFIMKANGNLQKKKNKSKQQENVMQLQCDLISSKQESILDEPKIERLISRDELNNKSRKLIKCAIDGKTGQLIWDSGSIWFKKAWNVLVGAWADLDNNLIEIRNDNTLRYIDGYGPFQGEFIGFQKLHIKMPNNKYMTANLMGNDEIQWENGEKWTRCTDKGCLIM